MHVCTLLINFNPTVYDVFFYDIIKVKRGDIYMTLTPTNISLPETLNFLESISLSLLSFTYNYTSRHLYSQLSPPIIWWWWVFFALFLEILHLGCPLFLAQLTNIYSFRATSFFWPNSQRYFSPPIPELLFTHRTSSYFIFSGPTKLYSKQRSLFFGTHA